MANENTRHVALGIVIGVSLHKNEFCCCLDKMTIYGRHDEGKFVYDAEVIETYLNILAIIAWVPFAAIYLCILAGDQEVGLIFNLIVITQCTVMLMQRSWGNCVSTTYLIYTASSSVNRYLHMSNFCLKVTSVPK